jgi:hypothetical protein
LRKTVFWDVDTQIDFRELVKQKYASTSGDPLKWVFGRQSRYWES